MNFGNDDYFKNHPARVWLIRSKNIPTSSPLVTSLEFYTFPNIQIREEFVGKLNFQRHLTPDFDL